MDIDEEPSSYLNYLNDGDAGITYLLGGNEGVLEPMFMDVTNWPSDSLTATESNNSTNGDSNQPIKLNIQPMAEPVKPARKAPLILTEENCALITSTKAEDVETCTIIAENGTEQTILVGKNFGVVSKNNAQNSDVITDKTEKISVPQNVENSLLNAYKNLQNVQETLHNFCNSLQNFDSKSSQNVENSLQNVHKNAENIHSSSQNVQNILQNLPNSLQNVHDSLQNNEVATKDINILQFTSPTTRNSLVNILSDYKIIPRKKLQKSLLKGSRKQPAAVDFVSSKKTMLVTKTEILKDEIVEYKKNTINMVDREQIKNINGHNESFIEKEEDLIFKDEKKLGCENLPIHYQNSVSEIPSEFHDVSDPDVNSNFQNSQLEFRDIDTDMDYQDTFVDQPENVNYETEKIQPDSTTYINYDPIVKEKENGIREIYLTEKDIYNDAKFIQLLNADGSVITIDKALLNSVTVCRPQKTEQKSVLKPIDVETNVPDEKPPDIKDLYTTVTAKKCTTCGFLAENVDDIVAHILENHKDRLTSHPFVEEDSDEKTLDYECRFCKEVSFANKALRNKHYKEVHSDEVNKGKKPKPVLNALLDGLLRDQQKALKKYKSEPLELERRHLGYTLKKKGKDSKRNINTFKVEEMEIKCLVRGCVAFLPTEELLKSHQKMHLGDRPHNHFKCLECSEKFYAWRFIKQHVLKVHKQDYGSFICVLCSRFKTFSSAVLKAHMNSHKEDDQTFKCPVCSEGFPSYNKMKNHKLIHNPPEDPNDVFSWVLHRCDLCEATFNSRKNLKTHTRNVHQNYRPYVCKICGHKTTRKATLELHMRQHTGAKPYKCIYCDYRSADHNCLRRHLMTHVNLAKQYSCPYCPFACIQTAPLKNHIITKHPNRPGVYKCKHCSYSSINLENYLIHEKSHKLSKNGVLTHQIDAVEITASEKETKTDTDDDTQSCFFEEQPEEQPIDTGGITIPAGFELPNLDGSETTTCSNAIG